MARPRSNSSGKRKGGGTSFGKRSDAEKSFRKRERRPPTDDSRRPPRQEGGFSARPSRSGPDESSKRKPFSPGGPFKKTSNFRSSGKPDFKRSSGRSSDFRSEGGKDEKGPFQKRSGGPFKSGGFSRPSGGPRADNPFNKDRKKPYTPRKEGDAKFPKKPFQKPFRNQDESQGEDKPERKSFIQSRVIRSGDFTKTIKAKPTGEEPKPRLDSPKKEYVAKKEDVVKKEEGLTRLNKYIANSGVGSRRQADELIKMGLIKVNGTTITELGTKVKPGDEVRYEDRVLKAESLVYVLLNKPKGFITTTDDPQERNTVMSLVASACKERIYPVGRLDRNTTGLLLLTNDGDLADKLTHPSYKAKKIYKVELDRPITKNDLQKIMDGVRLEEGRAIVDDCAVISDDYKTVGLEIHIGWNRVVRRIFESLEYSVVKLDRSVFAGLDKKDLGRGQWRFLKSEEIVRLKHFK